MESLFKLKISKFDVVICITVFILVATNQIMMVPPFNDRGSIAITNGDAIPQESNYTITQEISPSVSSAIIFNYTMSRYDGVYFDTVIDSVSKLVFNFTLESTQNNTDVRIDVQIGYYSHAINLNVGTIPRVYSLEPDMAVVGSVNFAVLYSSVRFTSTIELEYRNIILQADFDNPVSPVVFNWLSSDEENLFDSNYTEWMSNYGPEVSITSHSEDSIGWLDALGKNQTIYLSPGNYTLEATWDGRIHPIPAFILTIPENTTTACIFRMKAVKLYLNISENIPLASLSISRGTDYSSGHIYEISFEDSRIPEYLFLPPSPSGYIIRFSSMNLLSRYFYPTSIGEAIYVSRTALSNSTYHLIADIHMNYLYLAGFIVTPQNLVQIALAEVLFAFIIIRIILYFNQKRPRISLKDPRLIPIILIGFTTFIPWFHATRVIDYYFDTTIHVAALGPFPLVSSWTDSGLIFLELAPNGIVWGITSLLMFWLPLIWANYAMTPPSNLDGNLGASLLLLIPVLNLGFALAGLSSVYSAFSITTIMPVLYYLILVPVIFFFSLIASSILGKYTFGPLHNQLELDMKLAEQLDGKRKSVNDIVPSETTKKEEKQIGSIKEEQKKILDLVLVNLQFLILLIPSAIGYYFIREWGTGVYTFDNVIFDTPVFSFGQFLEAVFGYPQSSIYWILLFPLYYILTFGVFGHYGLSSRKILTLTLFILWASVPILFLSSFVSTLYYNFGIEWCLISLPYYLMTSITIVIIGQFVRDEIRLRMLLGWIILSLVTLVPGGLILNWISVVGFASNSYSVLSWIPLPIATVLLLLLIWPIQYFYRRPLIEEELDSEVAEILQPDDETITDS